MKRFLFTMMTACIAAVMTASTVNYTADNTSIFKNPERGFITEFTRVVTPSEPYCVKGREAELMEYYANRDQMTLILVLYYLDNYKDNPVIPQEILDAFDEDMQVLRELGMKTILRFAYTEDYNDGTIGYDAPLSIVQSHIDQYKSHWQANADVIYVFQAGFVGAWGEWYFTSNFGNMENKINASRRALVDALLAAVPADRCIQLRTPLFKTSYLGSTDPLTAEEAYQNTPKARLAHHNDAVLENEGNLGTYVDEATQKPYIAQETFYVPIGGESCILDADVAAVNASYDATIAELSNLHWTFIQSGYSPVVTEPWRKNGTLEELNRRLGYRYQLVSGRYSDEVEEGGKLSVKLQIRNAGFAPLYNERPAYIVLKNGDQMYRLRLKTDPRTWRPNGEVAQIEEQLALPNAIPAGTYELYLFMPDAYSSLESDPRYSVRFANPDVWDEITGMNNLNATVIIKEATTPPPSPGEAVLLPATLNKANVDVYSEDMTWYESDYFDLGPEDALNTSRWAEWKVELRYPGEYIVSVRGYCANGHAFGVQLLGETETPVAQYTTSDHWDTGEQDYTEETKWNLSAVTKGTYRLRVSNVMEWGQPKLLSLTLGYVGELPTSMDAQPMPSSEGKIYDLLGRSVPASYHGVVITDGQKMIR